jgi:hypothetical protein
MLFSADVWEDNARKPATSFQSKTAILLIVLPWLHVNIKHMTRTHLLKGAQGPGPAALRGIYSMSHSRVFNLHGCMLDLYAHISRFLTCCFITKSSDWQTAIVLVHSTTVFSVIDLVDVNQFSDIVVSIVSALFQLSKVSSLQECFMS